MKPGRQVCPLCGHDDEVVEVQVESLWIFLCDSTSHAPMEWRPTEAQVKSGSYRTAIGEELGVYDDLLECVFGGMAEYGVIEHRYASQHPLTYKRLVSMYGHTSQGPKTYTASAFLGRGLGQLWREGLVVGRFGPATGYWKYNTQVGCYGPVGQSLVDDSILTWDAFATKTLGVSSDSWPLAL